MAYQDNITTYSFGQMGSIIATGSDVITSNGETGMANAVFCAITFIEDCTFTLLVAETAGLFPASGSSSILIDAHGQTTSGITFPAGLTIYGRWTAVTLASGKAVAYIGY